MTFRAGPHLYNYVVVNRKTSPTSDRICITVKITNDAGQEWTAQTDLLTSALSGQDVLVAMRLVSAFSRYDLTRIPENFEIPVWNADGDPAVHRCTLEQPGSARRNSAGT